MAGLTCWEGYDAPASNVLGGARHAHGWVEKLIYKKSLHNIGTVHMFSFLPTPLRVVGRGVAAPPQHGVQRVLRQLEGEVQPARRLQEGHQRGEVRVPRREGVQQLGGGVGTRPAVRMRMGGDEGARLVGNQKWPVLVWTMLFQFVVHPFGVVRARATCSNVENSY